MSLYVAKGLGRCEGSWDEEVILDYPGGTTVVTGVLNMQEGGRGPRRL